MKIVVLETCALHLGYLGCYGNDWVATPNLDRLASEGIVFDQHYLDHPHPADETPLTERSAGTGRYHWPGTKRPGAAAGEAGTLPGGIACLHRTIDSLKRYSKEALSLLNTWQPGTHPVLWIEGPDLAPPWRLSHDLLSSYLGGDDDDQESLLPWPDPPVGIHALALDDLRRLQDTYAAVVTYWDAQLGSILDALREHGRLDEMVLCLTARYGLPLGEHGMIGTTRPWLHDALVHAPLLFRLPGAVGSNLRVPALTQPVDLLPTLGELLGIPVPGAQGQSLRPLMLGSAAQLRPYACSALRLIGAEEWLLRTPEWALLLPIAPPEDPTRPPQLYVKPDDRWEVNNLYQRYPGVAEDLGETLRAFGQAVQQPGSLVMPPLPAERSEDRSEETA